MDEELRIVLSKKEKVELFLSKLSKLKAEGSIPVAQYEDLKAEYTSILEEVTASLKTVKARLRIEFEKKAQELDNLQKEHDLWQARLNVGEIRAEAYWSQTKPLKKVIELLKKEVPKLRIQVNATSTAEIGGSTKVEIPELKIKKSKPKPNVSEDRSREPKAPDPSAVAATTAAESDPSVPSKQTTISKDKTFASELVEESVADVPKGRSSSIAEKAYTGDKKDQPQGKESVVTGKPAAIIIGAALIIVVLVFIIGRVISMPSDRNPPIVSGITISTIIDSSAIIEWTTDEKGTSQVTLRDPAGTSIVTEADRTLVTKHSVKVSNLKPNIKYQVTIKSADASGNEVESKIEQVFTLAASSGTALPVISDASVMDIADTSAVITWKTDKPATSQVMVSESGAKAPYLTEPRADLTVSHTVILTNLKPNVTYTFSLVSKDASGNQAIYDPGKTFTTLASLPVGVEVGRVAPDFTLSTIDGKSLSLSSFRGKVVLLNFWQKGCPACVREMPMFQTVFGKLPSDKFTILAINALEDETTVKDFKERWSLTFPILLDPKGKAVNDYKVSDIPATFFIDSQGVIREIKIGPFDKAEEIESIINSLLKTPASK